MSYSFSVQAASKDDAISKVVVELDNIVNGQPTHAADRQAALDAATSFINLLKDPDDNEQINVSMHGSLSWRENDSYIAANVGVSASVVVVANDNT